MHFLFLIPRPALLKCMFKQLFISMCSVNELSYAIIGWEIFCKCFHVTTLIAHSRKCWAGYGYGCLFLFVLSHLVHQDGVGDIRVQCVWLPFTKLGNSQWLTAELFSVCITYVTGLPISHPVCYLALCPHPVQKWKNIITALSASFFVSMLLLLLTHVKRFCLIVWLSGWLNKLSKIILFHYYR